MEAATAGQAPAEAEAQPEGQPQEQNAGIAEWQQSVDSRLGDAADSIRQMSELVQTRLPEPQAEPEPDFSQQLEDLFGGDPQTLGVDPQGLQEVVDQRARAIAQELVGPLARQFEGIQEQMTARELDALQESFPELADQKAADQLADRVVVTAEQLGIPQLAYNAEFVRMVHLSQKAQASAREETPAGQGPDAPHVETGGGAAPASSEGDPWDAIANAGRPAGPIW